MARNEVVDIENRLYYIEPNNLTEDIAQNGIPFPLEDYIMSVDMEIIMGSRYSAGDNANPIVYHGVLQPTNKNGTHYLTTEYTEISYTDPESNSYECFGLESLSIAYESWMVPTVTAKFVDVRGASLMMPQEAAYNRQIKTGDRKLTGGSFYKALFTFPYPEFVLKVKGFYGRTVTYHLVVQDVKSDFNADNGSFDVTVKFLGYIYRALTDIPMTLLASAPYLNPEYWVNNGGQGPDGTTAVSGKFSYDQGQPMPTIPQFMAKLNNIDASIGEQFGSTDVGQQTKENNNKKESLNRVKNAYTNFLDNTFKGEGKYYIEYRTQEKTRVLCFIRGTLYLSSSDVEKNWETFCVEARKYNEEVGQPDFMIQDTYLKLPKYAEETTTLGKKCENPLKMTSADPLVWANDIKQNFNYDISAAEMTEIRKGKEKVEHINVYSFDCNSVDKRFIEIEKIAEKEGKKLEDLTDAVEIELEMSILGLPASLGSMYKMAFAHADTFMNAFYNCLREIRNQNEQERSCSGLGVDIHKTNLPNGYGGEKAVPPFTEFYAYDEPTSSSGGSTMGETIIWPGKLKNGERLPEVQLVERLIEAAKKSTADYTTIIQQANETENNEEYNLLTLYDYAFIGENPYKYLTTIENKQQMWQYIYTTFALRLFYYLITNDATIGDNSNKTSLSSWDFFSKAEAKNLYRALPDYDKNTIGYIFSNSANTISFITKKEAGCPYDINKPFVNALFTEKDDKLAYTWDSNTVEEGSTRQLTLVGHGKPITQYRNEVCHLNLAGIKAAKKEQFVIQEHINTPVDIFNKVKTSVGDAAGNFVPAENRKDAFSNIDSSSFQKNPSVIWGNNWNSEVSLFGHECYYAQNNIFNADLRNKAKAYLFALGIRTERNHVSKRYANFYMILKRGAMLWRQRYMAENNEDPIFILTDEYKSAAADECYSIEINGATAEGYNLHIIPVKDKYLKYSKIYEANDNEKDAYIDFFSNWAEETYKKIARELELVPKDNGDNNPDFVPYYTPETFHSFLVDVEKNGNKMENTPYARLRPNKDAVDKTESFIKGLELYTGGTIEKYTEKNSAGKYEVTVNHTDLSPIINYISYDALTKTYWTINLGDISTDTVFNKSIFENAFKSFLEKLAGKDCYNVKAQSDTPISEKTEDTELTSYKKSDTSDDLKLATYMVLKNLYDRWLSKIEEKRWNIDDNDAIFKTFHYTDAYFRKIENTISLNMKEVANVLSNAITNSNISSDSNTGGITNDGTSKMSLYEFLAEVAQKTDCILLPFPTASYLVEEDIANSLRDMFCPNVPWSSVNHRDTEGFLCVYPGRPSSHLEFTSDDKDADFSHYRNDGFNIALANGKIDRYTLGDIANLRDTDGYPIPAFGVTYAKENQSFFTRIGVGMQNPQQTEASIAATMNIAAKGSESPSRTIPYGQDLYSIYANYSYTCDVTMMGDLQVMPFMMFQLNNIPMFRGVYQIIKVEHDISPGNVTTKFTGVRMAKYQPRYVDKLAALNDWRSLKGEGVIGGNIVFGGEGNFTGSSSIYSICEEPKGCLYGVNDKSERIKLITSNWPARPSGGWNRAWYGNEGADTKEMLQQLYTKITVPARVGSPDNYTTIDLIVNKNIASDFENIFKEIFGETAKGGVSVTFKRDGVDVTEKFYLNSNCCPYSKETALPTIRYAAAKSSNGVQRASLHNYGIAIDINAIDNPQIRNKGQFATYDGQQNTSLVIRAGHPVIDIFERYGWHWGGNWNSQRDYMHFCALNG